VFEGVRGPAIAANAPTSTLPLNEDAEPRFAGMAAIEPLGADDKYLMYGITFGETPTLSVGGAYDFQRHATRIPKRHQQPLGHQRGYLLGLPVFHGRRNRRQGRHHALGRGHQQRGHRPRGVRGGPAFGMRGSNPSSGSIGFRAEHSLDDYYAARGGLNFWIRKYTTNVKAEMAYTVDDTPTGKKRGPVGTVQWQLVL